MFRTLAVSTAALTLCGGVAIAQPATGNRANGMDYQPTPAQVIPREKAAGVRPTPGEEAASNRDLEQIDRNLLRGHGMSTSSVPKMNSTQ